ncbi:MAG TPA: ADP-forming succinate--CoA ligase subunit beta [Candidatus Merdisoma merdipullorum]|nr:ADP-forming succinate--CoA ligase subunit beta [Candidatus Merdisoma merdipullorum]
MKLLEYKAKELFDKYGVPTMNGCVIDSSENMEEEIAKAGLSYPVVVKAQVQIGGRGKAGGIRFADTPEEAKKHCEDLLFTELRGYKVNQLLIVEKSENNKTELYLSIMLDRLTKCPMIIFSANGGMEIEQTAKEDPDKIIKLTIDPFVGVKDYMAAYLLSKSGMDMSYKKQLTDMLTKLYAAFMDYSCMLLEINPLVINAEDKLVALDGKVDIDDSALFRLPDIKEFADKLQPDNPLIKEAAAYNFLYIPIEEGGTIAVTSNGSGMLMSCIDLISKEGMKVGAALDLGGGATADRIKEAIRILFSTPGIKAVLINIFGGITRCDEVAGGVKLALEGQHQDKIVVVRMEGTNKEKGLEIIGSIKGVDIVSVPGLRECVKALADRRDRL